MNKVPPFVLLLLVAMCWLPLRPAAQVTYKAEPGAPLTTPPETETYQRNLELSTLYKELNHFSLFAPLGEIGSGIPYVFSADVNPLYIFSNSIAQRINVGVGARMQLRMFQEASVPVRTPSYMPVVRVYYRLGSGIRRYAFLDGSFTHHSNGQDGPSLVGGQWNTRNGNFSTNALRLGMNWGKNWGRFRRHFAAYGIRHVGLGDFLGQDDALKGVYGQTRAGLDLQLRSIVRVRIVGKRDSLTRLRYEKEQFRLHAYAEAITDRGEEFKNRGLHRRLNTEVRLTWFPLSFREGGFFLGGGYFGEDPYNIYFFRHYGFFRFGFAAGNPLFRLLP